MIGTDLVFSSRLGLSLKKLLESTYVENLTKNSSQLDLAKFESTPSRLNYGIKFFAIKIIALFVCFVFASIS